MYKYDLNMLREKNKATHVLSSNKWKICNSIPICHILNFSARAPLWKMALKKVNCFSMKKEDYKFRVGCVSYLNLKQNKAFKEQVDTCLYSQFHSKTST